MQCGSEADALARKRMAVASATALQGCIHSGRQIMPNRMWSQQNLVRSLLIAGTVLAAIVAAA